MYRNSHWTLGLAAFGGLGFHLSGAAVVWSVVLTATAAGMLLSAGRIAAELGMPHPLRLLGALRGAAKPIPLAPCPHCGTAHAS
jgi:hypothetical protein